MPTTAAQITIVTNMAKVSKAIAPPTSVDVELSLMSSHWMTASTPAAIAAAAVTPA